VSSPKPRLSITIRAVLAIAAILALTIIPAHASTASSETNVGSVLLALIVILLAAKFGGDIAVRIGQPAVLGELIFGIIVGNFYLLGYHNLDFVRTDSSIGILSEIGVMLLLFQVGLETDIGKMAKVGASSFMVATLGIVAPFFLGWVISRIFLPTASVYTHVFIGATLCATSVGITARVLRDIGRIQTPEANIILGAAVIDDVQGLIVLAVIQGLITASSSGSGLSAWTFIAVALRATTFLLGAVLIGQRLSPLVLRFASRLKAADIVLTSGLVICFGFAYTAARIGLAPIVGAFAAGLMLDEIHWKDFSERGEHSIDELINPLAAFLVPIFFVRMGASVTLSELAHTNILLFAGALSIAAILGKQVCGLGVIGNRLNRLAIGIGMIPRGEVGLIFAAVGSKLFIDGLPVVRPAILSAIVIVVLVTTIITPPLLKWSIDQRSSSPEEGRL